MPAVPTLLGAGAAAAVGLAAAGIAWHDCLLVAASAVAVQRLFIARMDHGAPEEWRAALRCIEAGLIGLLSALGANDLPQAIDFLRELKACGYYMNARQRLGATPIVSMEIRTSDESSETALANGKRTFGRAWAATQQ